MADREMRALERSAPRSAERLAGLKRAGRVEGAEVALLSYCGDPAGMEVAEGSTGTASGDLGEWLSGVAEVAPPMRDRRVCLLCEWRGPSAVCGTCRGRGWVVREIGERWWLTVGAVAVAREAGERAWGCDCRDVVQGYGCATCLNTGWAGGREVSAALEAAEAWLRAPGAGTAGTLALACGPGSGRRAGMPVWGWLTAPRAALMAAAEDPPLDAEEVLALARTAMIERTWAKIESRC